MSNKKNFYQSRVFYLCVTAIVFLVLFYISTKLNIDACPDEQMRYKIPQYIFKHGRLPNGFDPEIIPFGAEKNAAYGVSYGFTPYLSSLVGAAFMKIASFFSNNERVLLIAARQVSTLSGTGTFFLSLLIGEHFFDKARNQWLFAGLVIALPQFMMVCGYMNSDAISIFATALVFYAWILNIKSGFKVKHCIFLGIADGILVLSYYYAYAFVLCSMFVYFYYAYKHKIGWKAFWGKGFLILGTALAVAGWFFVRNAILYDGDFMGSKAAGICKEMHAAENYKTENKITMYKQGLSPMTLIDVYNENSWIRLTTASFICRTGYMEYALENINVYSGYVMLFSFGLIGFICYKTLFLADREKADWLQRDHFFLLIMLLCIFIPIGLSMYYSFMKDFQPQGRYIMSMILPFMLLVTKGYELFDDKLTLNFQNTKIIKHLHIQYLVMIIYIALMVYCVSSNFPLCFV